MLARFWFDITWYFKMFYKQFRKKVILCDSCSQIENVTPPILTGKLSWIVVCIPDYLRPGKHSVGLYLSNSGS